MSIFRRVHFNFNHNIDRRTLLRGAGVAMSLPWLSAMQSAFGESAAAQRPRRFVAMTLGLGLLGENLNPAQAGFNYEPSKYLKSVNDLRDQFTVVSGTSHPDVRGGHRAEASILSANPHASAGGKNSVSLDQYMAKRLAGKTRMPSLVLSSRGSNSPSYTDLGAMIPAHDSPAKLFRELFVTDPAAKQAEQVKRARSGRSIMDLVSEDAKRLSRDLGKRDQDRLDQYFSSVRDLEHRLAESEAWANRPKPKVDEPMPTDITNGNDFVGRQQLMSRMIRLALQTDSTRVVSYHLGGSGGVVPLKGVDEGYHSLSHHGRDEEKLTQLGLVEEAIVNAWGEFIRELSNIDESGDSLLDRTSVFLTSNLGNASNHSNSNMPVLIAGGGFKHGQHLAFDQRKNYPLPNLYLSILQRMGFETDRFASSTGTMTGLEFA